MKIKLIFDIEIIANAYKQNETGIFRVAYEMFKKFSKSSKIELLYSNFNYSEYKKTELNIDKFFTDHNVQVRYANNCKRVKFIPFRKEKLFRIWYGKMGIKNYKTTINLDNIQYSEIYHSFYYPINSSLNQFSHLKKVVTVHDLIPILFLLTLFLFPP